MAAPAQVGAPGKIARIGSERRSGTGGGKSSSTNIDSMSKVTRRLRERPSDEKFSATGR